MLTGKPFVYVEALCGVRTGLEVVLGPVRALPANEEARTSASNPGSTIGSESLKFDSSVLMASKSASCASKMRCDWPLKQVLTL